MAGPRRVTRTQGTVMSIRPVKRIVQAEPTIEGAGVKLRRRYDLEAPQGVRGRNSDNTRVRERLGWEPSTSLHDGLVRTYRWIYDDLAGARSAVVGVSA